MHGFRYRLGTSRLSSPGISKTATSGGILDHGRIQIFLLWAPSRQVRSLEPYHNPRQQPHRAPASLRERLLLQLYRARPPLPSQVLRRSHRLLRKVIKMAYQAVLLLVLLSGASLLVYFLLASSSGSVGANADHLEHATLKQAAQL
jgi:hypothetical protein